MRVVIILYCRIAWIISTATNSLLVLLMLLLITRITKTPAVTYTFFLIIMLLLCINFIDSLIVTKRLEPLNFK